MYLIFSKTSLNNPKSSTQFLINYIHFYHEMFLKKKTTLVFQSNILHRLNNIEHFDLDYIKFSI
jgi:hypothetical protein